MSKILICIDGNSHRINYKSKRRKFSEKQICQKLFDSGSKLSLSFLIRTISSIPLVDSFIIKNEIQVMLETNHFNHTTHICI